MFIFQLFMTVIGIFLIPVFMFRMVTFKPEHKDVQYPWQKEFKDKWFNDVFGNKEDGIADVYYAKRYAPSPKEYKPTFWRTYNWLALRNPIHNLALKMGVDEDIIRVTWSGYRYTEDRIGREGFVHSIALGISGKKYHMWRWCKLWYKDIGIEMNIGYKNFNIQDVPKHYKYSFTISINPIKKFER